MAARNKATHDAKTRERIQTTQLIKRLTAHALGEIELSSQQVRAIEILLKKTLPDLQSITLEGGDSPVQFVVAGKPSIDANEWLNNHKPE